MRRAYVNWRSILQKTVSTFQRLSVPEFDNCEFVNFVIDEFKLYGNSKEKYGMSWIKEPPAYIMLLLFT